MATVEELKNAQNTALTATGSPTVSTATEGENRVNAMFDAQKEAQLKQLESGFNQSLSAAQEAKDKISPQYQTAANDLAVQYERNRRNFNQQAAGNGLNTGTASQAALAQNSAYQRDFGGLRKSESEAIAEADRGIADLKTKYQDGISAAVADNDYKRSAALLDQYNRDKQEALAKAEALASFGIFSGFEGIYTPEEIDSMRNNWYARNPQLALMTGSITQDQYKNLAKGRPMNEGLDANGNRIVVASSSGSGNITDVTGYGAGVPLDYTPERYPLLAAALEYNKM